MTEPQKIYDAAVVGAGPGGAACARRLSQAGLDVLIIDRVAPKRYKTCGGGVVQRALGMLDFEVESVVESRCYDARVSLIDRDVSFNYQGESPIVSTAMRAEFDNKLLQAARGAGASFLAPCNLTDLAITPNVVELATSTGTHRARFCVAADGASSRTARAAGWADNEFTIPALESEIRVAPVDYERFAGVARFDLGLPTRGYGWVFPKRNHLSVGVLCRQRGWGSLREDLDTYIHHLDLHEHGAREDHGYVIPIAPRSAELARGRVLLVGDAAGLTDPVTCEGISGAIASGQIAADAIVESLGHPDRVAATYSRLLEEQLLPELRTARRLARLLYEWPRLRAFAFRRCGEALCDVMGRVFAGEDSYRGLLRRPSNYFKLVGKALGIV